MNVTPLRLPDVASIKAALAGLDSASADADLIPAFAAAFPGFEFGLAHVDDDSGLTPGRSSDPTARVLANCGRG